MISEDMNNVKFDLLEFREETIDILSSTIQTVNRFEGALKKCSERDPEVYNDFLVEWEKSVESIYTNPLAKRDENGQFKISGSEVLRCIRDVLYSNKTNVIKLKKVLEQERETSAELGMFSFPNEYYLVRDMAYALIGNRYNEVKSLGWKRELFADLVMTRTFLEGYVVAVGTVMDLFENAIADREEVKGIYTKTFKDEYDKYVESARKAKEYR